MLKVKHRGERGGRRAPRRDQRLTVQKLPNKEEINETHQHDRVTTADVKVSKIFEISDLIVCLIYFQGMPVYLQALIISPIVQMRQFCAL